MLQIQFIQHKQFGLARVWRTAGSVSPRIGQIHSRLDRQSSREVVERQSRGSQEAVEMAQSGGIAGYHATAGRTFLLRVHTHDPDLGKLARNSPRHRQRPKRLHRAVVAAKLDT